MVNADRLFFAYHLMKTNILFLEVIDLKRKYIGLAFVPVVFILTMCLYKILSKEEPTKILPDTASISAYTESFGWQIDKEEIADRGEQDGADRDEQELQAKHHADRIVFASQRLQDADLVDLILDHFGGKADEDEYDAGTQHDGHQLKDGDKDVNRLGHGVDTLDQHRVLLEAKLVRRIDDGIHILVVVEVKAGHKERVQSKLIEDFLRCK